MLFDPDRLRALRDCCRDEDAFIRLQQLLVVEQENESVVVSTVDAGFNADDPNDANAHSADLPPDATVSAAIGAGLTSQPLTAGALGAASDQTRLLQGIAEATSKLLTDEDHASAVNAALATLGQVTGVDRVYIFENHPHPVMGNLATSQRFEWVRSPSLAQIDNSELQNFLVAENGLGHWPIAFMVGRSIRGLTRDLSAAEQTILGAQGILAILLVPILIRGSLWGFIGFDNCQTERQWSDEEEALLQLMATSIGGAIARQQAEAALIKSEARLHKIAANVPGMIYQFLLRPDHSKQILYISSGSLELLELSPEVIQADASLLFNLCHPQDQDEFKASLKESLATMQPWNWEGRIITPSGQLKWVQGGARPDRQPNGALLWDGVMVDITERKQAEEECRQSEARYRAMLDASPDLMFRLEGSGKYLDCKGNADTDIPREEIIGRYPHDTLPADVAERCMVMIQRTLETSSLQTLEYQLPAPEGLRDYEARLVVSGPNEILTVVRDVTERKQVEEELRASEDRLQSFFNATFEAVIVHDYGHILDVNHAAEGMFGYSTDEMIGMPVINLVAPPSKEDVQQRWRSLSSPDQPYEYEGVGMRQDGTTFIGKVCAKAICYKGELVRVAGIRDITTSKQAEAQILQSEARNRALVNAIPDLMFRIHRDGTYLDCKAEKDSDILLPAEELIGKTVYEVMPPDLAQQRMYYVQRALTTGEMQHFEYQMLLPRRQPSRSPLSIRQAIAPTEGLLRDYEARILLSGEDEVLAIVRDITDRKHREVALRLSEEKFSKAFRSSPNPMTIATLHEGRLIEVNDSFLQLSGYRRDEVIDRTVHALGLWANATDRQRVIEPLKQQGSVRSLETTFRTKSGELRTGLFSAEVINIGGELCMLDITVDITERKQAEQQLWLAAERDRLLGEIALRIRQSLDLDQILDTTVAEVCRFLQADRVYIAHNNAQGAGIVVAEAVGSAWPSLQGQTLYQPDDWGEEATTLFAGDHVQVVNDTSQANLYPELMAYYQAYEIRAGLVVPLMVNDQMFGLLGVNQCSGPRQWEPFEVSLLEQLATQVAIAIQQAQLYRQVQNLNAGLEQQVQDRTAQLEQKMLELQELNELKDEFLNAFSHDLRTPVMGMSLVLNNLLNQPGDTISLTRSIVERMVQSSSHQLNLITSLLQAHSSETRGVALQYELVQLSLLTQVIVEDLEPLICKNQATLTNIVPTDLPLVTADPMQLRRVFENLITNALHHNPPGGKLKLDATVETEMIRFTLQDDGVGMGQDVCDRLFERYARGNKNRHSTGIGLGLYLCRQIITAHGGQIGVNSVVDAGSTFWLTLPLAMPPMVNPEAHDPAKP